MYSFEVVDERIACLLIEIVLFVKRECFIPGIPRIRIQRGAEPVRQVIKARIVFITVRLIFSRVVEIVRGVDLNS